jgi:hypothetical protein
MSIVERLFDVQTLNKTARDTRLPYSVARSLNNVFMRKGKLSRRNSVKVFSDAFTIPALAKQTSSVLSSAYGYTGVASNNNVFNTPISYGLIPHSTETLLDVMVPFSFECVLTLGELEELVSNPWHRKTKRTIGGSKRSIRPNIGCYVVDRSILVNWLTLNYDSVQYDNVPKSSSSTYDDIYCLTNYAIAYSGTGIYVTFDLYNDIDGAYEKDNVLTYLFPQYQPGRAYHLALVYDSDNRNLNFYVDGDLVDSFNVPVDKRFVTGVGEAINGTQINFNLDTVLLNEFTCRGGLASTIKPFKDVTSTRSIGYVHCFDSYTADDPRPEPLCHSPSSGTSLCEIRFWSKTLSAEEVSANMFRRLDEDTEDLAVYFPIERAANLFTSNNHTLTIHSGNPIVNRKAGLLNNYGLLFSENSYAILSFDLNDYLYIDPLHSILNNLFSGNTSASPFTTLDTVKDFTVEVQIETPNVIQTENTIIASGGAINLTGVKSDTRQSLAIKGHGLLDGKNPTTAAWEYVRDENDTVVSTTQGRFHRAYDQTIWSAECSFEKNATDNHSFIDTSRIPVARGLITPENKIAFEFFGDNNLAGPKELRVVSNTVLEKNKIYNICFRKRVAYSDVMAFEIFINGILDASLTIGGSSIITPDIVGTCSSATMKNYRFRDFCIGASYVNNVLDRSIKEAASDSLTVDRRFVAQHRMSPWQDQPGRFNLGYLRLWNRSLSDTDIFYKSGKDVAHDSDSLVLNIKASNITGETASNQSPFSSVWKLGYKGWGTHQGRYGTDDIDGYPGWAMEDKLGFEEFGDISPRKFIHKNDKTPCNGLGLYTSTLDKSFGLISVFGDVLKYSDEISGVFKTVRSPNVGYIGSDSNGATWEGVNIADKLIITKEDAYPKVFDGSKISNLGFKNWGVHKPVVETVISTGSLTSGSWYGVAVAYFSEKENIWHVSPVTVVKMQATYDTIRVKAISPHPDKRVSAIVLCITLPQVTQSLAEVAPLFGTANGFLPNKYYVSIDIFTSDGSGIPVQHPTTFTSAPLCSLCAAGNDRLYLAGDRLIPDIIYYSQVGNPQVVDTIANRIVLQDSSGDPINKLIFIYSALFAFKPNSIWKIDEVGSGIHNSFRYKNIGPVNSRAIQVITIPDTGQDVVVFWSSLGPYMFDEVNIKYIGYPIEGPDVDFSNIDTKSVISVHDQRNRQVWFYYKEKDETYINKAFIYDYRIDGITQATGVYCNIGLNIDLSKQQVDLDNNIVTVNNSISIVGGNNRLYRISDETGPDLLVREIDAAILSVTSSTEINLIVSKDGDLLTLEDNELNDVFITVYKGTREIWGLVKVKYNVGNTLYLEDHDLDLEVTDSLFVGLPFIEITFPWDDLGIPYFQKQVTDAVFSIEADTFSWAMCKNYNEDEFIWINTKGAGKKRINVTTEDSIQATSIKLKLLSISREFIADSVMFRFSSTGAIMPDQW